MTPAEAGFDGSILMPYRGAGSPLTIRFRRGPIAHPDRFDFGRREFCCWRADDGTVQKLLYRNDDGEIYELQFVPLPNRVKEESICTATPST